MLLTYFYRQGWRRSLKLLLNALLLSIPVIQLLGISSLSATSSPYHDAVANLGFCGQPYVLDLAMAVLHPATRWICYALLLGLLLKEFMLASLATRLVINAGLCLLGFAVTVSISYALQQVLIGQSC